MSSYRSNDKHINKHMRVAGLGQSIFELTNGWARINQNPAQDPVGEPSIGQNPAWLGPLTSLIFIITQRQWFWNNIIRHWAACWISFPISLFIFIHKKQQMSSKYKDPSIHQEGQISLAIQTYKNKQICTKAAATVASDISFWTLQYWLSGRKTCSDITLSLQKIIASEELSRPY